jgi:hypothetical protein
VRPDIRAHLTGSFTTSLSASRANTIHWTRDASRDIKPRMPGPRPCGDRAATPAERAAAGTDGAHLALQDNASSAFLELTLPRRSHQTSTRRPS